MSSNQKNTGPCSTSDAVEILDRVLIGDDVARREAVDKAVEDALIGQMIYDIRTQAGLTQKQLAELAGTDQAVISRLEDADYEGHTMSMLRRIAKALGKRVEVRFVDAA
jgi:ribosome-binding protein aMBF1 (putative translation factor)